MYRNITDNIIPGRPGKPALRVAIAIMVFAMFAANTMNTGAQMSQTLFFMERVPQSSLLNPGYQHYHNFHLGLPVISSFNINARTNFTSFNSLVFKHPQYDSLITILHPDANLNDFTSRLRNRNFISPDLHLNLLSFGFRINRSFVSFNLSERMSGMAMVPKDLIMLGLYGNEQFVGRSADFSNIGIDMNYYREYAAGYSYMVDDRLNVGARAKLLFGKANVSFSDTDISLYTDPETYEMRLSSRLNVNMSLPVTLIRDEEGEISDIEAHFDRDGYNPMDFVFNSRNSGFAIDLGGTYRIIEPVTLYASIIDLGFINWKENVYNLSVNGDFDFEGLDLSPLFDSEDDSDPAENILDALEESLNITDTENSYRRGLPTRIYLGGMYELNDMVGFGLLGRSGIYRGKIEQAVTLSANSNIGRWLSASLSYSMMNNSYNNVGVGLSLRGGGFQLYLLSDNLNSVFYPHRTNSANLWFGLNLVFGHRKARDPLATAARYGYDAPAAAPVAVSPERETGYNNMQRDNEHDIAAPDTPAEPDVIEEAESEDQNALYSPAGTEPEEAEPEDVPPADTGLEETGIAGEFPAVGEPEYSGIEPGPFFYLVSGSFETMTRASQHTDLLKKQGFDSGVLRSGPGLYRVYLYVFDKHEDALAMLRKLQSADDSPPAWILTQ